MPTEDFSKIKPMDDQADWVLSFVDDSRDKKEDFRDIWEEVEFNWLVRSPFERGLGKSTRWPLADHADVRARQGAVLVDPETHQAIMSLVSQIVLNAMGEPGFIAARRTGLEDTFKEGPVTDLLEYILRLEGHFTQFVLWVIGSGLYGTGILESFWHFEDGVENEVSLAFDPLTGEEVKVSSTVIRPVYDDPRMTMISPWDFFPDHGETMIPRMYGAAKRIKMTAQEALRRARQGIYDERAVELAIHQQQTTDHAEQEDRPSDDQGGLSNPKEIPHLLTPVSGFEYYGKTPFRSKDEIGDSEFHGNRVITTLSGVTVRSDAWPRRLPFFEQRMIPRPGSFWGVAPAEIMRHDQDFASMLKQMLAHAIVRSTRPPHIVDRDADVTIDRLRAFTPDVPVFADRTDAVQQIPYNPPVQPAFAMYGGVKQNMRESTGALGAIQGLGLGTKRFSATEAAGTFQQALDRPELYAQVLEREHLPPLGRYLLKLGQEFYSTEDVQRRIGIGHIQSIGSILGDFDLKFQGTRLEGNKAQRLQSYREIFSLGANPIAAQLIPWIPLIQKYMDDGLASSELSAMVGNPELVQLHLALGQLASPTSQQSGNNNGTVPSQPPSGLLPAQLLGETS